MYARRFVWIAVAALLVFGLIFAFGMDSARQQAWMQGYMMGQMATGNGGAQGGASMLPYMALQGGRMGGGGGSPLLLFGGIMLVIFGLRFIFGGPGRRHGWARMGEHAGHYPPWWGRQQGQPSSEGAEGQNKWPCPPWWGQPPAAETPEAKPEAGE